MDKILESYDEFLNEENINALRVKLNQLFKRKEQENTKKYDAEIDSLVKKINALKGSVKEHHGDNWPDSLLNMRLSDFLDKLKKHDESGYEQVEKIINSVKDELNESVRHETRYIWSIDKKYHVKIQKTDNDLAEDAYMSYLEDDNDIIAYASVKNEATAKSQAELWIKDIKNNGKPENKNINESFAPFDDINKSIKNK